MQQQQQQQWQQQQQQQQQQWQQQWQQQQQQQQRQQVGPELQPVQVNQQQQLQLVQQLQQWQPQQQEMQQLQLVYANQQQQLHQQQLYQQQLCTQQLFQLEQQFQQRQIQKQTESDPSLILPQMVQPVQLMQVNQQQLQPQRLQATAAKPNSDTFQYAIPSQQIIMSSTDFAVQQPSGQIQFISSPSPSGTIAAGQVMTTSPGTSTSLWQTSPKIWTMTSSQPAFLTPSNTVVYLKKPDQSLHSVDSFMPRETIPEAQIAPIATKKKSRIVAIDITNTSNATMATGTFQTPRIIFQTPSTSTQQAIPQSSMILQTQQPELPDSPEATNPADLGVVPLENNELVEDPVKNEELPRSPFEPIIHESDSLLPVQYSAGIKLECNEPMKEDFSSKRILAQVKLECNEQMEESTSTPVTNENMQSNVAEADSNIVNEFVVPDLTKVNLAKWTVEDVHKFIKELSGCSDYADQFIIHRIDGQALMLLKMKHLQSHMGMSFGLALKIMSEINLLRRKFLNSTDPNHRAEDKSAT